MLEGILWALKSNSIYLSLYRYACVYIYIHIYTYVHTHIYKVLVCIWLRTFFCLFLACKWLRLSVELTSLAFNFCWICWCLDIQLFEVRWFLTFISFCSMAQKEGTNWNAIWTFLGFYFVDTVYECNLLDIGIDFCTLTLLFCFKLNFPVIWTYKPSQNYSGGTKLFFF